VKAWEHEKLVASTACKAHQSRLACAQVVWARQRFRAGRLKVQTILSRIAAGEERAFAELVNIYQGPMFGFLGRMGMGRAQAEDIAQEAFLRAWTHLPSFDAERAQFGTWLFTIARNLAYSALQNPARLHEMQVEEPLEQACEQPDPVQTLERKQQRAQLQLALRQLPFADRSALALVYVHELALADVAHIEGASLVAIKTRLHRARHRLRELLQSTLVNGSIAVSETRHE
jgi:RNA polymerase sigma-70 factor, ECF subfamily